MRQQMVPLEFTRPWLLAGLLLAVPVLVYYFRWSLSDFPRRQRWVSLITRVTIVLLLIAALAGLTWLHATHELFVMVVVDQSLSIGKEAEQRISEQLAKGLAKAGRHRYAVLPFGAEAGTVRSDAESTLSSSSVAQPPDRTPARGAPPASPAANPSPSSGETVEPDEESAENQHKFRDGTNLAAALEAAAGYIPPGYVPRIIVLSDGNQTAGDAVASAVRSRVPISTVLLPTRAEPEVQVSEVRVPAEVREGEPFYVEVAVHANHDDEGLLEIYRGDHKVLSERRAIKSGENRFQFPQSLERQRLAVYSVRISGLSQDTLLDNNADSGLVYTAGKPRVLVIEDDPDLIRDLAYAFEDEGVFTDVRPATGLPESLADLQNYELLILSNVPATAFRQKQMELVRTYVQELGGGLMMLGGEQSFGLGGYYKTTVEEVLPVRSDFEKEQEKPSLGMVLVIDKSGSMEGDKMEMAKSAARNAAELLGSRDQLAVVAFDGDPYVISPMQPASNKGRISDEIAQLESGGGTAMYPAMESAYRMLQSTSVKLKHVILLTDGASEPGSFEDLAEEMAGQKMTVSAVGIGDADHELLESIARLGRGRYYATDDPSQVPQIFAKETLTASKSSIDEQPFVPQIIRATRALAEIDLESAPFLLGYVITRPKPTAEVILATEKGDPLLVWWRYGLGMSCAFTSDAKTRWGAEWISWQGYSKFWTQVARQTMRKSNARGIAVAATRQGPEASLSVDAVNDLGQFIDGATVDVTLIDPRLDRVASQLVQTAPGRYVSTIATAQPGPYHLEIALHQHGQTVYRQSRGLVVGYSDELRIRPPNEELLRAVAEASGGVHGLAADKWFEETTTTAHRPTPLWPHLTFTAVILLLLDVALRRIDFSVASSLLSPLNSKHQY